MKRAFHIVAAASWLFIGYEAASLLWGGNAAIAIGVAYACWIIPLGWRW